MLYIAHIDTWDRSTTSQRNPIALRCCWANTWAMLLHRSPAMQGGGDFHCSVTTLSWCYKSISFAEKGTIRAIFWYADTVDKHREERIIRIPRSFKYKEEKKPRIYCLISTKLRTEAPVLEKKSLIIKFFLFFSGQELVEETRIFISQHQPIQLTFFDPVTFLIQIKIQNFTFYCNSDVMRNQPRTKN